MGTPKISTFVIALVWIGFFAATFATFLANITSNYDVTYDGTTLETFNKLEDLDDAAKEYKTEAIEFKEKTGVLDIIGEYFSSGYNTLRITVGSIDIFTELTNKALDSQGLDIPIIRYLKTSIVVTVLIFIIIGVMLSAILKKDV